MTKIYGATGVKGVDVTTEKGTVKYNADRKGYIEIDNAKHVRQAVSEGMVIAAPAAGFARADGYPCPCGFPSLFRECSKCGKVN
jgi:hypothetical protein